MQNIRRGGFIAAIVGICMLPWNLLKSSNNFSSYLSAYSVFLSSIAGVMVVTQLPYADYVAADLYSNLETAVYKDLVPTARSADAPET